MNVFINIFIFIVKKMINEMKFIFTVVYKMNTYEIKKKKHNDECEIKQYL